MKLLPTHMHLALTNSVNADRVNHTLTAKITISRDFRTLLIQYKDTNEPSAWALTDIVNADQVNYRVMVRLKFNYDKSSARMQVTDEHMYT